jgi:hypothetical protein
MAVKPHYIEQKDAVAKGTSFRWDGTLGFLLGIVIGAAAGLIGVGGDGQAC